MDTKHIHCMLEKMAEYGKRMVEEGVGTGDVNLEDAKKVVEMVGELAEAEYHALIAKEMRKSSEEDEAEEKYIRKMLKEEKEDEYKKMKEEYGEDEGERRFYDNYRYANGRFAPKGRGTYRPRGGRRGYVEPPYYHVMPEDAEWDRDMDRMSMNRMYYSDGAKTTGGNMSGQSANSGNMSGCTRSYSDGYDEGTRRGYEDGYRDGRKNNPRGESRYDKAKRGYEETKQMHKGNNPEDKALTMKEAEKFTNVAIDELMDALEDASPDVKNMVKTKVMSKMQKMV